MSSFLKQLKNRRIELGFKQHDMYMRIGVSRQQYQRLESRGNPRLNTLELVAKGLKSRVMLIPEEDLRAVRAVLDRTHPADDYTAANQSIDRPALSDDPWQGMLGEDL